MVVDGWQEMNHQSKDVDRKWEMEDLTAGGRAWKKK